MLDFLKEFAQNRDIPLMAAFALGLLTAISPCPLATNITATAYIAKGFTKKRHILLSGVLYTLGRALSYTVIGLAIYFGASKFELAHFFQSKGEMYLAPILIVVGLIMLGVIRLDFLGKINPTERFIEKMRDKGFWGALVLGVLFALAFCPYSGALFFGMLMPMIVSSPSGLYLPLVFALGTGLPVILFTYLIAFSINRVGVYFNILQKTERVMRYVAGGVFVLTGVYYALIFLQLI